MMSPKRADADDFKCFLGDPPFAEITMYGIRLLENTSSARFAVKLFESTYPIKWKDSS